MSISKSYDLWNSSILLDIKLIEFY